MEEKYRVFVAVLLAWARLQPELLGPKKCRRKGVGALLRELRHDAPDFTLGPYIEARREGAQILESHCRICGRCDMAGR